MAAVAIFLHGKGVLAVEMAGAARFGRLHLRLGHPLVLRGREIELHMAIAALVNAGVQLVAEHDIPGILYLKIHLSDGMALGAFIDLEGALTVMAGGAGPSPFLLGPGYPLFWRHVVKVGV